MKTKSPKVAIITLNWNGLDHLEYFLPTAYSQTYDNFFVLVVDNASEDNSIKYIENSYPDTKVIQHKENLGYSKGFNSGIFQALNDGADYLLISSNDVKLDKNIVKEAVNLTLKEKNVGFMAGKIYNFGDEKRFQYAGGRMLKGNNKLFSRGSGELDVGQYEDVMDFDFMDDACFFTTSELIKKVGPYDEDFFFDFEETEWNVRIRNNGFRIVYNPKMIAKHRVHGSTGGSRYSPIPEYYHWRGKLLFYFKTSNSDFMLSFLIKFLFLDLPLHWAHLIRMQKTYLIYHNFWGVMSALKRIIEIK